MERTSYSLKELCKVAEVTERTVRYYIAEGLLPPPSGTGPFSRYGYEHLLRLKFIKRLQEEYLPLREIKNLLAGKTITELENIARRNGLVSGTPTPGPNDSQDDYLERLLQPGQDKALRFLREEIAASGPSVNEAQTEYTLNATAFGGARALQANDEATSVSGEAVNPVRQAESATDENEDLALAEFSDTPTSETIDNFANFSAPGQGYQPPMPPAPAAASEMAFRPKMTLARSAPAPMSPASLSSAAPGKFLHKRMASQSAEPTEAFPAQPVPPPTPALQAQAEGEQPVGQSWERIVIAPGIELHIESNIANQHRPALSLLLREIKNLLGQ